MAFAVTKQWNVSPYSNGLGPSTALGTAFIRKVSCEFNGGTTTGSISLADLGATSIKDVIGVIMKSTNSVFVGSVTASTIPLTATGNCTVEIVALVNGI